MLEISWREGRVIGEHEDKMDKTKMMNYFAAAFHIDCSCAKGS